MLLIVGPQPIALVIVGALLFFLSTHLPWKNKEYAVLRTSRTAHVLWLLSIGIIASIAAFDPLGNLWETLGVKLRCFAMSVVIAAGIEISAALWNQTMRRTAVASLLFWCTQTWLLAGNVLICPSTCGFFGWDSLLFPIRFR
jgi:hypothetical protein